MTFDEDDYILGLWIVVTPFGDETLISLKRGKNSNFWEGETRTKSNGDSSPRITSMSIKDCNEDEALEKTRMVVSAMQSFGCEGDEIIVKGGADKFFDLAKDKDWLNIHAVH